MVHYLSLSTTFSTGMEARWRVTESITFASLMVHYLLIVNFSTGMEAEVARYEKYQQLRDHIEALEKKKMWQLYINDRELKNEAETAKKAAGDALNKAK
jgi:hypothetical protein